MAGAEPQQQAWLSLRAPWATRSLRHWHLPAVVMAHCKTKEAEGDGASWFFLGFLYGLQVSGGRRAPAAAVEDALMEAHAAGVENAKHWIDCLLHDALPTAEECEAVQRQFLNWLSICSLSGSQRDTRILGCLIQVGLYWEGSVAHVDRAESATWCFLANRLGFNYNHSRSVALLLDSLVDGHRSCQTDIKRFQDWMGELALEGALTPFRSDIIPSTTLRPPPVGKRGARAAGQHPRRHRERHSAQPSRDPSWQQSWQHPQDSCDTAPSGPADTSVCVTSGSIRSTPGGSTPGHEEAIERGPERGQVPSRRGVKAQAQTGQTRQSVELLWRIKRTRSPRLAVETWSLGGAATLSSDGPEEDGVEGHFCAPQSIGPGRLAAGEEEATATHDTTAVSTGHQGHGHRPGGVPPPGLKLPGGPAQATRGAVLRGSGEEGHSSRGPRAPVVLKREPGTELPRLLRRPTGSVSRSSCGETVAEARQHWARPP